MQADPHPFAPADPATGEPPVVVWNVETGLFILPFEREDAGPAVVEAGGLPLPVRWGPPSLVARLRRRFEPAALS